MMSALHRFVLITCLFFPLLNSPAIRAAPIVRHQRLWNRLRYLHKGVLLLIEQSPTLVEIGPVDQLRNIESWLGRLSGVTLAYLGDLNISLQQLKSKYMPNCKIKKSE